MNRRNDWQGQLTLANKNLNQMGYEIKIEESPDGDYSCDIIKDGKVIETYAEGYFEDELSNLVDDAWAYIARNKPQGENKQYSKSAKQMVAEQIIGMLENNVLQECGMESFIGWVEDGGTFFDTYDGEKTEEEINEAIELAKKISPMIDALSWELNTDKNE